MGPNDDGPNSKGTGACSYANLSTYVAFVGAMLLKPICIACKAGQPLAPDAESFFCPKRIIILKTFPRIPKFQTNKKIIFKKKLYIPLQLCVECVEARPSVAGRSAQRLQEGAGVSSLCLSYVLLSSVHFSVYSAHCTLCTLYTVHWQVYTVNVTVYTLRCTPNSVHCTLYSVDCTTCSATLERPVGQSAAVFGWIRCLRFLALLYGSGKAHGS